MNKQIEKLALEAGFHSDKHGLYWDQDANSEGGDLEKFAELIIKQCIQELTASGRCDPYTGDLFDCEYNKCLSTQITMLSEVFEIE